MYHIFNNVNFLKQIILTYKLKIKPTMYHTFNNVNFLKQIILTYKLKIKPTMYHIFNNVNYPMIYLYIYISFKKIQTKINKIK